MTRETLDLKISSLLLAILIAWGCTTDAPAPGTDPKPPVILISIDTLRADRLPVYGYDPGRTPHLDRLARDSVVFENAITPAPLTLPAHASILTGLAPQDHGVRDNLGYRLDAPTWVERLRAAGYETRAFVSAYVLRHQTGIGRGFEPFDDGIEVTGDATLGHLERPGSETVHEAVTALDRHVTTKQAEAPLTLWLHLFEPHAPYEPPAPFDQLADPYDGEIAAADAAVGTFLDALRRHGLYEEALIVVLADHGEGLGDHGELEHGVLLHRETIRVPLIVKIPGNPRAGERIPHPVSLLDVAPTILESAGLPEELGGKQLPGRSLLQPLASSTPARRVASETFYPRIHFGWSELRSLTGPRFHLVEGPRAELYDLDADPGETRNVVSEQRRVYHEMRDELRESVHGDFEAPGRVDPEDAARLAALGYASGSASGAGEDGPRLHPKDGLEALARLRTAYDLGARGESGAAVEILRELVAEHPAMVDARHQLATHLAALGRVDEALAEYGRVVETAPALASGALIESARLLRGRGDLDAAGGHARAVLDDLPAEAEELLAEIALDRGRLDAAEAHARRSLAADTVPRSRPTLLLAMVDLARKRPQSALERLDPLASRVESGDLPPQPSLDFLRADALARLGRAGEAEAAFRREVTRFPAHSRAWAQLAVLYATEGRFDAVEPTLKAMVRAHPTRQTHLLAAETARRLGDVQGAEIWQRRAEGVGS